VLRGAILRGVFRIVPHEDLLSTEDACQDCGDEMCESSQDVCITRVRHDAACESPFETWFRSKKRGSVSVLVKDACGNSSTLCYEGVACSLRCHNLAHCDEDLPVETLRLRVIEESKVLCPLIQPATPDVVVEKDPNTGDRHLRFFFSARGGRVADTIVCVRNLLPFPFPGAEWKVYGGPGKGLPTYTSPNMRKFVAILPLPESEEAIEDLWEHLETETRYEVFFIDERCECSTRIKLCLPTPRPGLKPSE
jgi:hypothetical protein